MGPHIDTDTKTHSDDERCGLGPDGASAFDASLATHVFAGPHDRPLARTRTSRPDPTQKGAHILTNARAKPETKKTHIDTQASPRAGTRRIRQRINVGPMSQHKGGLPGAYVDPVANGSAATFDARC